MSETAKTLAIDVGGSGLKMLVLDAKGEALTERTRVLTPRPAEPEAIVEALLTMDDAHGSYDRISCGFPGVVVDGVVQNAPNLDGNWHGYDLRAVLEKRFGKPARVANDADVQGYGAMEGKGVELVITLGTGLGSALFVNGHLVPNLELGHHPFKDGKTYEQCLGKAAREEDGKKKWNKAVGEAIAQLEHLFNYRRLYIGGGNAKKLKIALPDNAQVVPNRAGLLGGIALWLDP
ncbi:MAG: ROK family protein [Myxococcota bacterium]